MRWSGLFVEDVCELLFCGSGGDTEFSDDGVKCCLNVDVNDCLWCLCVAAVDREGVN